MSKKISFWALASVVLITMLLRPPVAAIGPILNNLESSLGISQSQAGLLASLPVLCFGFGAFAGPWLVRRFGLTNGFTLILSVLLVTLILRAWFGFVPLLSMTVLLALAIAVSNVLFPTLIRAEFPNRIAGMTALYTALLALFASVAASASVPLLSATGDWRWALTVWAIPALLALVVWFFNTRTNNLSVEPEVGVTTSDRHVWVHPITWSLVGFFGFQSLNFYAVLNWLPAILQSKGFDQTSAGALLGLTTIVGIPSGLIVTANLKRFKSLAILVFAISLITALGLGLLAFSGGLAIAGCVLAGIGLASSFPISLALVAMKANSKDQTTLLSAVVQGFGYLIAAAGTYGIGLTFELTGGWLVGVLTLTVIAVVQGFIGLFAGSDRRL